MRAALSGEEKFKLSSTKTLKKLTWRTRRHVYPTGVIVDKNKSDLIYILRGKICSNHFCSMNFLRLVSTLVLL